MADESSIGVNETPKILVLGVGGAGCNSVNRMSQLGISGTWGLVAVNTDKQQLSAINDELIKVLIGKSVTQGVGTGGFVEKGARAAEASKTALGKVLEGTSLLFLTAGMGGGTGTGASPVIAEIAKQQGAIVCSIVTFPFDLERSRTLKAEDGIVALAEKSDAVIVINNNRLVELVPNLPVNDAFKVVDELIAKTVKGISETITQPSLINLDFSDVRAALSNKGVSLLAVGEARSVSDRIGEVVQDTLNNTLLDVEVNDATGVLIHITGGSDLTLGEAKSIGELLTQRVSPEANVVWGARVSQEFEGKIEVIAIFAGIPSPFRGGRVERETGRTSAGAGKYAVRGMDGKLKKGLIEI
ncbi:MAG: cell division protein FtsZ [Candidatus Diapherotrites archaeon]|nr:cell division protein FtsZ [Candidatus Diapherotrites archaeon]HIH21607.1 cell division protein FtsZ [Candidatus Diapherotrites archaeon]